MNGTSSDTDRQSLKTVLIVDDMAENLSILGEVLQPHYRVRAATSARRALQIAATDPRPDLILLDIMMPEMDGYECLARLKENPRTSDIPVIFLTAMNSTEDEQRGLDLGAVDYITKPLRPGIVLSRIRTQMELKQARDGLLDQNALLEAELDRLMDILAHHLQEPVRQQYTYTQILERALPEDLSDLAADALIQILDGASRLRTMLHNIQICLAARRSNATDRPASAEQALQSVLGSFNDSLLAARAEITHDTLPQVWVHQDELVELFRVLIDNALRYRWQDRPLKLSITTARRTGNKLLVGIADNGQGISPEYRERVFRLFERISHDRDQTGTGLGLALARKIVHSVGGHIWIGDGLDGGITVWFDLPVADEYQPA